MPTILKRKLATIREIQSVEDIPNADSIVKVSFTDMHWICVMGKNENPLVGMKVIFFEVDAVLPDIPVFEFMRDRKFRVKTLKLRGVWSQGLAIRIDRFPEVDSLLPVGTDVTELLKVEKFEIPESLKQGDTKGSFPSFIARTDEERCQNIPNLEEILINHDLSASVKIDGSSATFYLNDQGEFGVCSHNLELKDGDNPFWNMARKYNIEKRLRALNKPIALQGELAGPGVQSNRAKFDKLQVFMFTAQDYGAHQKYIPEDLVILIRVLNNIILKEEGCENLQLAPHIKVIKKGELKTIEDVRAFSMGDNIINSQKREGVVFRSMTDPSISFKFINPEYLIKFDL